MGKIIICRADELVEKVKDHDVKAVLSIEHPDAVADDAGIAPRLPHHQQMILTFWDIEDSGERGPDMKQISEGVDFIMQHLHEGDVVIHCHAGKSRSVAVALGVLSLQNPDLSPPELIQQLLEMRPQAAPNILIVEMVDKLSGKDGALLQAVKDDPVLTRQRQRAEESRQRLFERNPALARKIYPEKFNNKGP